MARTRPRMRIMRSDCGPASYNVITDNNTFAVRHIKRLYYGTKYGSEAGKSS